MEHDNNQYIGTLVRHLMPDKSSLQELTEAQGNVDGYIAVLTRIYDRIEREGGFTVSRVGDR